METLENSEKKKTRNKDREGRSGVGVKTGGPGEEIPFRVPEYNDPVESLNLSPRSTKALANIGIVTVEKLLNMSHQSLYTIKNIGKKSAEELLQCQEKLMHWGLQKKNGSGDDGIVSLQNSIADLNMSVRSTKALNNCGITTIKRFLELEDQEIYAIKNIGKKNIEEIISCRNNISKTTAYKGDFMLSGQQERIKQLHEIFRHIPKSRLDKPVRHYLACISGLDALINRFNAMPDSVHALHDLPSVFESVCADDRKSRDLLLLLNILTFDVNKALNDIIRKIFSIQKYNRVLKVLQERTDEKTLQEISDELGLTRERIRQIENRGTKLLIKNINEFNINLLALINVEYDCEHIITIRELESYLKGVEHLDLFVYILKTRHIWENYTFSRKLNVFYNNRIITNVKDIADRILALPDIIEEDKKEELLLQICQEDKFSPKMIGIEFSHAYEKSGKVYFRDKLSLARIYDYTLKKYYPSGIKVFDDSIVEYFKERITETFGNVRLPENNRAIYARIVKQAVLCDRGAYIHPQHITINKEIIEEIDSFIAASPRKVISFNELFETFKQKLLLYSNVNNRYFLQGVLNIYLGKKYFFTRDTVSKDHNASFTDEIEAYIKSRGEVHKDTVFAEFNGMSQVVFSMRTKNDKNIIYTGNGWYMHADKLKLEPDDWQIKNTIEGYVRKNPVSSGKMLELFRKAHPRFLANNAINTQEKLFGILYFMFRDDFHFSRPYIAKIGTDELSNKTVIRKYLKPYNSITIQELVGLCEEHHLKYFSLRGLIRDLNNEFLRIDAETLVRVEGEIDEDSIAETAKLLLEKIESRGFLTASKIDDYISFPKTDFEWNPFLLRSLVEKYMDDMIVITDIPTTDTYIMNSVFTDSRSEIDGYESLLRNIIRTRNSDRPFETADELIDWLKEQGLIIGNVPKCLLDESILSKDEGGKLLVPPQVPQASR